MKRAWLCALATVLLAATPAAVSAQDPPTAPTIAVDSQRVASIGAVTLGSAWGWALGLAAGAGIGYLVQPDAGESYFGASEWWIGGWIGSSVGSALGAHLVNGRRGSLPLGTLGSLTVAPVAIIVGAGVGGPFIVPAAQIGVSVVVERRTAARRGGD